MFCLYNIRGIVYVSGMNAGNRFFYFELLKKNVAGNPYRAIYSSNKQKITHHILKIYLG